MSATIDLQRFLEEDFFTLLGLENMEEEAKRQVIDALEKTVRARVFVRISETLDEEQNATLDTLESEQIIPYLLSLGIDIPSLLIEEAIQYRMEVAKLYESILAPFLLRSPLESPQPASV